MSIPVDDNRPWWARLWGMPVAVVEDKLVEGYCRYCRWQGSLSVINIHTVLCPKCDMPVTLRQSAPFEKSDCNAAHPTQPGLVCSRETGHTGYHTDLKKMYSWHRDAQVPAGISKARPTWCGREYQPGKVCTREFNHVGICYASAYLLGRSETTAPPTEHAPTIQQREKAGRGMITAKLKDGVIVAIEFHHEYKTVSGRRRIEPTRKIAYRNKSKVLAATEAKLYRLDEVKDADKPGVTTLVKTLKRMVRVVPHVNDRKKGLSGGRKAALRRLLCQHDRIIETTRCRKCGLGILDESDTILSRGDREAIWAAYWLATASERKMSCGCVVRTTVPGGVHFTGKCEKHEGEKEAA